MTFRGSRGALLLIAVLALVAGAMPGATRALGTDPVGQVRADAIALDGHVQLAWQPVANATSYMVYRGTSPTAITDQVTGPGGETGTSTDDATVTNGTTYYYSVHAIVGGIQEAAGSPVVQATPVARSCSTGNPIVLENCFPGNTRAPGSPAYNVTNTNTVAAGGIEGYATATSIAKGDSVDLKVNADAGTSFRLEIYRSGYYGGDGARLFSVVRDIPALRQPSCVKDTQTGLTDCSNWSTSFTLATTASWPTGAYVLKLIRSDTGADNQILVVVRDDAHSSDLLYGVPFATYQAYNAYGGKSLYTFNSTGAVTVAGTPRAVKVSYDRPFEQPRSGLRDWYTRTDTAMVSWLEREGYDVTYASNTDLERSGASVLTHKAYLSAAHDEYVSNAMRSALENARDAGVSLFFSGGNEDYWKIRFENSPVSGGQDRVQVCYKSTESGGADPSGIATGTWRDPAGANRPENALSGVMYVGDKDLTYFPLVVSAAEGADRVYRYTGLDALAPGTSATIGSTLVGWEWDARVANGREPAGVKTLASSPVTGNLIQADGAFQTPGSATVTMTKYTAPSGALVFATATNHWSRGLALSAAGVGEPNDRIQQVTTNVLADMKVIPQTPATGIQLDQPIDAVRPPSPTGLMIDMKGVDHTHLMWDPVAGADGYHVYRTLAARQGGQPLGTRADAALITGTEFTDLGLASNTTYYYVVTAVKNGVQSEPSAESQAATLPGQGDTIRINAGGPDYTTMNGPKYVADTYFTGGNTKTVPNTVLNTNDSQLYQDERWGDWSYAIPVPNGVYDVRLHFAELYYGNTVPGGVGKRLFGVDIADTDATPDLPNIDIYSEVGALHALVKTVSSVMVMDGVLNIKSVRGPVDDPEITAIDVIPATSLGPPTATATEPADAGTEVSRLIRPRVTFSRDMDATTISASSFTLKRGDGTSVPAAVSYDAQTMTATLDPAAPLDYSTTYTASVDMTAMATDGQTLAAPVTWTFTTQAAIAPKLEWSMPTAGAVDVSPDVMPHVGFTRPLDPATVGSSSVHLLGSDGSEVMANVTYDETQRVAMLEPMAPLALSTTYTVRVDSTVAAVDGVPLASPIVFSFTTAASPPAPPTVSATTPADGALAVPRDVHVTATFSRAMSAEMFTGAVMTLTGPNGRIAATVGYDPVTQTGTLVPDAPLDASTTYTARVLAEIHAADGTPLGTDYTWSFTTAAPPTVTGKTPADGTSYVGRGTTVTARFSRAMDASTITASSFTLRSADGTPVSGSVTFASGVATFNPAGPLAGGTLYTATLATAVKSADGTPLAAPASWSFRTQVCPCTLFSPTTIPARTNLATQDGRTGIGPWSYEFGVKVKVDQPMKLTAIRFYKNTRETGVHVGRVWTTSGVQLASVTFAGETASGWQQQALPTPLSLQAGTVYIVSVNANAFFGSTQFGLQNQVISGPLRSVVDPKNGVYGSAAGVFPSSSFSSTNYFTDVEVAPDGDPLAPTVVSTTPADAAAGVARDAKPKVTFSRPVDPTTVDGSTITLRAADGTIVPASVSYDDTSSTATVTPASPLDWSGRYTLHVFAAIRARDGMPLAAATESSFTVLDAVPVTVVRTIPANGDQTGTGATVRAQFSKPIDPATLTTTTFTLDHLMNGMTMDVDGTIDYDPSTLTATFTPAMPLMENSMLYTARVSSLVKGADGSTLAGGFSWQFTTQPVDPPAVTSTTPAGGATFASRTTSVKAVFNRGMDPTTITSGSYTLKDSAGATVAATVAYDDVTRTATLTPTGRLAPVTTYTANFDTTVKSADHTPLPAAYSWTFTTATCPCSLFPSTLAPVKQNLGTRDGRTGTGPWSYEMGVKVKVDEPMLLSAVRFWKSSQETGVHVGRVWTTSGVQLGSVTFTGETASGWQQQALPTPLSLQAGTTYIVSVNRNTVYEATTSGLATQVVSGPLRTVVDGKNGIYGASAGAFPTTSFSSTNYFTDVEVVPDGDPGAPGVVSSSPAGGSTGVAINAKVTVGFSRPVEPSTVSSSTLTLKAADGTAVPATVAYDDATSTATLTPSAPLAYAKTYAAHVAGVRARDGYPMASAVDWSFTTSDLITQTTPPDGSTNVGVGITPRIVFAKSLDPATVTTANFTVTGASGAVPATVAYDDASKTVTITPTAPFSQGATYTARVDPSVRASDGTVLGHAYSFTFTTTLPALVVDTLAPANGATGVQRDAKVTATFSRAIDASTVTTSSFTLKGPDGTVVPAAVSYDSAATKATLSPSAALAPGTAYQVDLTGAIRGVFGSPLTPTSWTFTTGSCPCSLFADSVVPVKTGNPTQDGRQGTGPWSYEFGVKFTVDQPMQLTAIRFYKDARETGSHTGTVWSATGTKLATVTFTGESASGWQTQALSTPVQLAANTTYVVSYNANAFFGSTQLGLASQVNSGPLHSIVDSKNGAYGSAAGVFPTQSYKTSNYFADVVVR